MDLPTLLQGDNKTSVTQSATSQFIALLLTSKFVASGMLWAGIPLTPENVALVAVTLNTIATAVYTYFATTPGIHTTTSIPQPIPTSIASTTLGETTP